MRLLHVLPNLTGGGAEQQMTYLVQAMKQRGHDVSVAYSREGPGSSPLFAADVQMLPLAERSNYDPRIVLELVRLIGRHRPDVVQTWITQMDVLAGSACALTRTPWVIREPSSGAGYRTRYKGGWRRAMREQVARAAAAVVSNSHAGDAYWASLYPDKRRRVVRNGIPTAEIEEVAPAGRAELGLNEDDDLVLYAGRLHPGKNLELVIPAIAACRRRRAVTLILCGDGYSRPALETLTRESRAGDGVRFMGVVPRRQLWSIMKLADLFLFPSGFEGMPNSVVEAMLCRCPLVLSDIPPHRELVDDDSALFLGELSVAEIVRALDHALDDREASAVRSARARERVANWSITAMASRYEALYEEILRGD